MKKRQLGTGVLLIVSLLLIGCLSEHSDYYEMPLENDVSLKKIESPNIENTNERCSDNLDNDEDGVKDCFDQNCENVAACLPEALCADGIDNNFNGKADCDDVDCAGSQSCNLLENSNAACYDGRDNDEDTLVDCDDPDCSAVEVCLPEASCSDMDDNDMDGKVDCDDSDCSTDAACMPESLCNDNRDNDFDTLIDCDDADCQYSPFCIEDPESSQDMIPVYASVVLKVKARSLGNNPVIVSEQELAFYDITSGNIDGELDVTDINGVVSIEGVQAGDRDIEISVTGYKTYNETIIIEPGMDTLDILITPIEYNPVDTVRNDSMFVVFKEEGVSPDSAIVVGDPGYEGHWGKATETGKPAISMEEVKDPTTQDGSTVLKCIGNSSWSVFYYQFGEEGAAESIDMSYWHDAKLKFDIKSNFNVQLKMEWGQWGNAQTNTATMWLHDYGLKPDGQWYAIEIPFREIVTKKAMERLRIVVNFVKITDGEYQLMEKTYPDMDWTPPEMQPKPEKATFSLDNIRYEEKILKLCLEDQEGRKYCEEAE